MTETMKAVVKVEPAFGAEAQDKALPRIEPDQVLVKVRATSICGTDVHIYKWDEWSANRIGAHNLPQTLGHEVAGEVVEIGGHVKRVKVGTTSPPRPTSITRPTCSRCWGSSTSASG
jgi:threonine 3-dehydrogenase